MLLIHDKYHNALDAWFGSKDYDVLQIWSDSRDTVFIVAKYNGELSFIRMFPVAGEIQISVDGSYKL